MDQEQEPELLAKVSIPLAVVSIPPPWRGSARRCWSPPTACAAPCSASASPTKPSTTSASSSSPVGTPVQAESS
jgi:hypothetical protein